MITGQYQAPSLLILICIMSAMAFVMSAYMWLWHSMKDSEGARIGFVPSIIRGQFLGFIFIVILSLFIGVFDFHMNAQPLRILGEIIILGTALAIPYVLTQKENRLPAVFFYVREMLSFGVICLLGWVITIGLGYGVLQILRIVSVVNGADSSILVIFIPGLLWNVPILWMYQKILKNEKTRSVLQGQGFRKFLWPVLMAYTMLLIPLMMQQIANSEQWNEMKNAKIIREASVAFPLDLKSPLV